MNLCNYDEIRNLLSRHGFHFSKSLGQNFLIDPSVPMNIAEASGADETCGVLEIGPGIGPLTAELAQRAAKVVSIELDKTLLPVLAGMEQSGVAIDAAAFRAFLDDVQGQLDQLTAHVYELAGTQFNIRSAQQLGDVLFGKLGLPHGKKTKSGYSTSADVLEKLRYEAPIVSAVLEYLS